jgi:1-hydroxycarotenoid 3,4-desaturase
MRNDRVLVIGGGIGGLSCAIDLAAQGVAVEIVERAARCGGKMRECSVGGAKIDAGPTVFTMRWVFDELFEAAGAALDDHLTLAPLDVLARHAWDGSQRFDLYADIDRAADAVAAFSSPAEGRRYRDFCAEAGAVYRTLKEPFLASDCAGPLTLARRIGGRRIGAMFGMRPFETLWHALSTQFTDPRLRQLFGRYATYVGSSPFAAPATLMLIAHVEQDGVWAIAGGMQRLAEALERLARTLGVTFRFAAEAREIVIAGDRAAGVVLASGERLDADAVVVNADAAALADGLFGRAAGRATEKIGVGDRSLSAITWGMVAETRGFPLLRHNVFFSADYAAEFDDLIKQRRPPLAPTVYVCAQDRGGQDRGGQDRGGQDRGGQDRGGQDRGAPEEAPSPGAERLLLLVNAPAIGDRHPFAAEEIEACEIKAFRLLERCGLEIVKRPEATVITTPADFNRLFPATGGALYGRASHGWMASFRRPAAKTRIPGLYLAGGSTHPGAGVPMAALSGRLAARRLLADRVSTRRFRRAAMSGGISTR